MQLQEKSSNLVDLSQPPPNQTSHTHTFTRKSPLHSGQEMSVDQSADKRVDTVSCETWLKETEQPLSLVAEANR